MANAPNDTQDARNQRYLDTAHLTEALGQRSVRGGAMMLVAQGSTVVAGLAGTAVLARLLTPRDFGLLAMAATLTRLVDLFKDLGLAMATVQRRNLTQQEVSFLFWVNLGLGAAVSAVAAASAPLLAWFYGEPELNAITCALAASFMVSALGVQHGALLRRQMEFRKVATVRIASSALSTLAGIGAALSGLGYWALVITPLTGSLLSSLGLWLACGWRPARLSKRPERAGSLLAFGGHLTAARLLGFFARNLDNILIGRFWGGPALAFYSKAYQLLMLPVQQLIGPLTGVIVPALSRLQEDEQAFRRYYFRAISSVVLVTMPAIVLLAVAADSVVAVLLGPQWSEVADIFRLLFPAAFVGTLNGAASWAWVSLSQTERQLRWSVYSAIPTSIAFAISVPWGVEAVAVAYSAVQVALRYFGLSYCYRGISFLRMADLGRALWRPTLAALGAGALTHVIAAFLPAPVQPILALLQAALIFSTAYAVLLLGTPGGWAMAREATKLVGAMRGQS